MLIQHMLSHPYTPFGQRGKAEKAFQQRRLSTTRHAGYASEAPLLYVAREMVEHTFVTKAYGYVVS
jgi:hypothetical protein